MSTSAPEKPFAPFDRSQGMESLCEQTFHREIEGSVASPHASHDAGRAAEETARRAARAAELAAAPKDAVLVRIEKALADGLQDVYRTLSPDMQVKFRDEGEELAVWLREAADSGRVSPHQVLLRVEKWLNMVASSHFDPWVRQEAFLRAQRMIKEMMYADRGN